MQEVYSKGVWRLIFVREGDVLRDKPAAATGVELRTEAYRHPLLMEWDV